MMIIMLVCNGDDSDCAGSNDDNADDAESCYADKATQANWCRFWPANLQTTPTSTKFSCALGRDQLTGKQLLCPEVSACGIELFSSDLLQWSAIHAEIRVPSVESLGLSRVPSVSEGLGWVRRQVCMLCKPTGMLPLWSQPSWFIHLLQVMYFNSESGLLVIGFIFFSPAVALHLLLGVNCQVTSTWVTRNQ